MSGFLKVFDTYLSTKRGRKIVDIAYNYGFSLLVFIIYAVLMYNFERWFGFRLGVSIGDAVVAGFCFLLYKSYIVKMKPDDFLKSRVSGLSVLSGLAIVGSVLVYFYLSTTIGLRLNEIFSSTSQDVKEVYQNTTDMMILLPTACLIAPVCEEFLFRLCVYNLMKSSSHWFVAACFSSLCFGLVHGTVYHLIYGTLFGLFMVCAYEYSGRKIVLPIICHVVFNAMSTFGQLKFFPDHHNDVILIAFASVILICSVLSFIKMFSVMKQGDQMIRVHKNEVSKKG